ncbi:hypothetical protein BaRGS_00007405 [Batillaria attramentaria]|uniref:FAD-dependent oxidoreductase domain-containing protein 2 n=1 Tax=Batillaria attramentaria TaxID=370345 RepID=A0ABD0LPA6_9CAEN
MAHTGRLKTVALTLVSQWTLVCLLLLAPLPSALTSDTHRYHDYCVVGGGPAGLQLGFFLERANRDYIIFERSNVSGHFFEDFPRHRTLISINKRNTGKINKEFNLRHDWNSLLSDDESLLFRHYSKEMFPHADRLLDYLRDYQQKLGIKVQFNTEVRNIRKASDNKEHYQLDDQRGNTYQCKVLVVATGLWKPNIPNMKGIEYAEGYETVSLNPDDYEGKRVLILGNGNAAFEVAEGIYGATNLIHVLSGSRVRLAWATHYVGDVRAVNNALLDTYQLKSLDGFIEGPLMKIVLKKVGDKILPDGLEGTVVSKVFKTENFPLREFYDKVIRCLGFTFDDSVFQSDTMPRHGRGRKKKFPAIGHNYESINLPGVFIAGAASHSLDFRKSAGGFLHGFRYTTRALHKLLENRYEGVPWPSQQIPVTQLLNYVLKRMNEASGVYQMFSMLGDVITISDDGKMAEVFEEFPVHLLDEFSKHAGREAKRAKRVLVMVMEFGANFSGPGTDTLRENRANGNPKLAHNSNFLHPVFYYYETLPTEEDRGKRGVKRVMPRPKALHHVVEDFLTQWDRPRPHITPLRHFLDHITQHDLRSRFDQACFFEAMTHKGSSLACSDQYLEGQGLSATKDMMDIAVNAGLIPFLGSQQGAEKSH